MRVFVACSLDGFIAGPGGDLSWLPAPVEDQDYGYRALLDASAAILMGRATYDVAERFEAWPYGELPVFVATSRPLDPAVPTVEPVSGSPAEVLAAVRARVDGGLYLDGGALIRSFLDVHLVDELTVTIVGVILGEGVPLFAGSSMRHRLRLVGTHSYPTGLVQLRYVPA